MPVGHKLTNGGQGGRCVADGPAQDYDLGDREVATLQCGVRESGCCQVDWSAANIPQEETYFYRLQTENFSEAKKLIPVHQAGRFRERSSLLI